MYVGFDRYAHVETKGQLYYGQATMLNVHSGHKIKRINDLPGFEGGTKMWEAKLWPQ